MKVKIFRGNEPLWYSRHVGSTFEVLDEAPNSNFDYTVTYPKEHMDDEDTVAWIKACDCEIVPELTLEDAFDEPDSKPWTEVIEYPDFIRVKYVYPATASVPKKERAENLVAYNFNNMTGKNITCTDVLQIVELYQLLLKMEN
jgi:hypothetical protein